MITSGEKWGFDSNIIVYGFDEKSPFYKRTRNFFEDLIGRKVSLFITQQNILEVERVLISFYKQNEKRVVGKMEEFLLAFNIIVLTPIPSTIYSYHRILEKVAKHPLDIYLAATYLDNDVDKIFSANEKHFSDIPGFAAINPYRKDFRI